MSPLYKENADSEGKTSITPIENSIIGAKILQDINNDLAIILGQAASDYAKEQAKTDLEKRTEEKSPKKETKEEKDSQNDSKVEKAKKHLQDTLSGALNYEYAQLFLYEYTHMGSRLVPSTFRAFVKMSTGKHLEEFDEEQKTKLKE
jgi:TorA maturation chaperone TorD